MKSKNTQPSTAVNLQEHAAINHLRVDNLEEFLNSYDPIAYYVSSFSVLAQLEAKVKLNAAPEEIILCSYKPDGEVMFRFVTQKTEGALRLMIYHYISLV